MLRSIWRTKSRRSSTIASASGRREDELVNMRSVKPRKIIAQEQNTTDLADALGIDNPNIGDVT